MNKFKKMVLVSVLALSSVAVNAQVITYGNLSTDAAYNIIADTDMGREYMRFDEFDMTYDETVTATSVGGIYEDWSIANSSISDDFINAMFSQHGENACSTGNEVSGELCGYLAGWTSSDFGFSFAPTLDYYAYLSGNEDPIGLLSISSLGKVNDYEGSAVTIAVMDSYSYAGNGSPLNLLIYRENTLHIGGFNINAAENNITNLNEASSVPAPATLGLLGLVMAGLSFRRNKNRLFLK